MLACTIEQYIIACSASYLWGYPHYLVTPRGSTPEDIIISNGRTYIIWDKISDDDYYGLSTYDGSRHRLSSTFIMRIPFKQQLKALL